MTRRFANLLAAVVVVLTLAHPLFAKRVAAPRPTGISEDYLVSLGTGAPALLISQLEGEQNAKYYRGLVARLCRDPHVAARGNEQKFNGLRQFVERISQSTEPPEESVWAASEALVCIGTGAGPDGIQYLISWAKRTVGLRRKSGGKIGVSPEFIGMRLRDGALSGLGRSGDKTALKYLLELEKDLAVTEDRGTRLLRESIKGQIEMNRHVSEDRAAASDEKPQPK